MWEDDNEGFVACFLIKKDGSKSGHGRRGCLEEGAWDAIHVIQVGSEEEEMAQYCLTSTIMLSLTTDDESSGKFGLSGSIRRQMKMELAVADGHLCNMGRMIEELEGKLRNSLDQVLPPIPAPIPQTPSTCVTAIYAENGFLITGIRIA
jgi:capping protein beta